MFATSYQRYKQEWHLKTTNAVRFAPLFAAGARSNCRHPAPCNYAQDRLPTTVTLRDSRRVHGFDFAPCRRCGFCDCATLAQNDG